MQVFLPESNFAKCAEVLDTKRLVKQLLEGRQIMNVLSGESTSKGWANHPAVRMFEGYEQTLYSYLSAIRFEMQKRGYKWEKNWAVIQDLYNRHFSREIQSIPFWMSDEKLFTRVVVTHRGRLWEKDPIHYSDYSPEGAVFMEFVCCPDKCTYYWATHNTPLIHLNWEEAAIA